MYELGKDLFSATVNFSFIKRKPAFICIPSPMSILSTSKYLLTFAAKTRCTKKKNVIRCSPW